MNDDISSKIHDIKTIVEIPDNSIFIFSALIFLVLFLIFLFIVFLIKFIKNRKTNERKIYYKKLEDIDYSNTKDAAYSITVYIRLLAKSEREKKLAYEIIEELDKYKYKKEVEAIDSITKAKVETFMDVVDV